MSLRVAFLDVEEMLMFYKHNYSFNLPITVIGLHSLEIVAV